MSNEETRATAADAALFQGKILAYRVFDAGDTIDLEHAERLAKEAKRLVLAGPLVEGLVIATRPLEIDVGEHTFELVALGRKLTAPVTAHLFDFGVVTFLYELPVEDGTTMASLTPLCDALYDSTELDAHATKLLARLEEKLGAAIDHQHPPIEPESFTVIFAKEVRGATIHEVAHAQVTAKLLLGETCEKPLSSAVCDDILKNAFSYLADDLVIVDWNSALVIEPSGSSVVPHILELATSQLMEFRYYDTLLDHELRNVYEKVEQRRQRIIRSPYALLTRQMLSRFMELTEFTERVDNAIKSVGDVYLARVYLAALRRFRVPEWRESVESKLTLVSRAYELLKADVESTRNQLLEIIVVVLIVAELVTALRSGH
jgi:hypothetical protein